jgi:hypothetical protein
MEQTECSETLAFKLQMPVKHPKESIHYLLVHMREILSGNCSVRGHKADECASGIIIFKWTLENWARNRGI